MRYVVSLFQRENGVFSYAGKATPLIQVLFALPSVAHKFPKTSSVCLAQGPERDEFAGKDQLAYEYPLVEEGKALKIDHLLQKRHSESQSTGDDFSAAVATEKTVEPYLAWRLRSGYQSR
jgi:hypothetical protein